MDKCAGTDCLESVKTKYATYCSLSCSSKATRKKGRTPKYALCLRDGCREEFDKVSSQQKYCSHKCSAIVSNRNRATTRVCQYRECENTVQYRSKYCSPGHRTDESWLLKLELAKTTGKVPVSPPACKELIRRDRGWYCEIEDCGVTHWKGQEAPLTLDHIDGHADNHVWSNLRLICPMCDAFLPTYKARNRGNGRHTRRDRYKNGQSY